MTSPYPDEPLHDAVLFAEITLLGEVIAAAGHDDTAALQQLLDG